MIINSIRNIFIKFEINKISNKNVIFLKKTIKQLIYENDLILEILDTNYYNYKKENLNLLFDFLYSNYSVNNTNYEYDPSNPELSLVNLQNLILVQDSVTTCFAKKEFDLNFALYFREDVIELSAYLNEIKYENIDIVIKTMVEINKILNPTKTTLTSDFDHNFIFYEWEK